jgi:uncharacterized protein (DUF302 family)
MKKVLIAILFGSSMLSCNTSPKIFATTEGIEIRNKVDQAVISLDSAISAFDYVLRIDHSRLAEREEVYTPPAVVTLFSNPEVNSRLLKINPLVGIDLPYKVLCYSEPDLSHARISYTSPEFIMRRHDLSKTDLSAFSNDLEFVINAFPESSLTATDFSAVEKDYGLIIKKSDYDFKTTLKNLKKDIQEQGDTQIFGEIDFKEEAAEYNIEIESTTLMLFGAPAPGGKAMYKSPRIGLDAFCQKLLVYKKEGEVFIAYNDIIEFSELYYQTWTIPQRVVNYRINSVFENAITK